MILPQPLPFSALTTMVTFSMSYSNLLIPELKSLKIFVLSLKYEMVSQLYNKSPLKSLSKTGLLRIAPILS